MRRACCILGGMKTIDYDGRRFRATENTDNGEVSNETLFDYRQEGAIVWATYRGGAVRFGTLLAEMDAQGHLDMRYQHLNTDGTWKTGICTSSPEVLPDGRLRLHERWRWTCGDASEGTSILEETIDET